jgi:hypothetical protein
MGQYNTELWGLRVLLDGCRCGACVPLVYAQDFVVNKKRT